MLPHAKNLSRICPIEELKGSFHMLIHRVRKKRGQFSRHSCDKSRHSFVIFGENHPDKCLMSSEVLTGRGWYLVWGLMLHRSTQTWSSFASATCNAKRSHYWVIKLIHSSLSSHKHRIKPQKFYTVRTSKSFYLRRIVHTSKITPLKVYILY